MRRLVIATAVTVALVIAAWLVAVSLGKGYVQDRASSRLSSELGGPAKVHIGGGYSPGLLRGDLGNVRIVAGPLERDGIRLERVDATVRNAHVSPSAALSGSARMRFSGIIGSAAIAPNELRRVLRRALVAKGVPGGSTAKVTGSGAGAKVVVDGVARPLQVSVEGGQTVRAVSNLGPFVLSVAIPTGSLPYELRLTGARIVRGGAALTLARSAGTAPIGGG